ncbi:DM13 domain-containing protein [Flavobacterium sp. H122]|uniref:DM13 domain-containing protein n=1 Tax=Flavobacterium sp. H122 TaxID=2529860 RepID=UPI0010AAD2F4|nr:DM13 domain-containing protein [Flavobacterium sp. H122]
MNKYLLILLALFTLSCEKEGELTRENNNVSIPEGAILKYTGSFVPTSGITAAGVVKVYLDNGVYKLEIEDANVSSGPDLKVYLSKSDTPTQYVNLGNFAGNGTSTYAIPAETIVPDYSYVLIHCQQYNHLFAVAKLNSN